MIVSWMFLLLVVWIDCDKWLDSSCSKCNDILRTRVIEDVEVVNLKKHGSIKVSKDRDNQGDNGRNMSSRSVRMMADA